MSDEKKKNIRIQLFKKYVSFRIQGEEKKYNLKKDFVLSRVCKNPHEVLDCLLRWIVASKEEKHEMNIYFDMQYGF